MRNIYRDGFIYQGYEPQGQLLRYEVKDAEHQYIHKFPYLGSNLTNGQDVVEGKDYRKQWQTKFGNSWDDAPEIVYNICEIEHRRIIALPVKVKEEGEKELTAMQEAINDLKFMANRQNEGIVRIAWNMAITICEQHLDREKEQHFKTYMQALYHNMSTEETMMEEQVNITKDGMFWKEFIAYFNNKYGTP